MFGEVLEKRRRKRKARRAGLSRASVADYSATTLDGRRFLRPLVENSTLPSISANRVWSRPRPTPCRMEWVPRWRTMMLPASMGPDRRKSSRPGIRVGIAAVARGTYAFFYVPCCVSLFRAVRRLAAPAMPVISISVVCVTVAHLLAMVLAAAELDDAQPCRRGRGLSPSRSPAHP